MERIKNDDFDFLLLQMKRKLAKDNADGKLKADTGNRQDFGLGFTLQLPEGVEQADDKTASEIFWSEKRPDVILTSKNRKAGFTFQLMEDETPEESLVCSREKIKQLVGKIDERTVFYDMGETKEALWFEYKSFAGRTVVYNILFLFQAGEGKILGTFYCIFEKYDKWKPEVLKILETIRTKEAAK